MKVCESCFNRGQIDRNCPICNGIGHINYVEDYNHEEKDTWNLVDKIVANKGVEAPYVYIDDIKIFIQKIKQDMRKDSRITPISFYANEEIFDKRSGNL